MEYMIIDLLDYARVFGD